MSDLQLFRRVFHSARVIDVDFSVWDQQIRVAVIAWEAGSTEHSRVCSYFVDFIGVRSVEFEFRHWEYPLTVGHYQWDVYDFRIEEESDLVSIQLFGSNLQPLIRLVCSDYSFSLFSREKLSRLFPGWDKSLAPLARPGLEALIK